MSLGVAGSVGAVCVQEPSGRIVYIKLSGVLRIVILPWSSVRFQFKFLVSMHRPYVLEDCVSPFTTKFSSTEAQNVPEQSGAPGRPLAVLTARTNRARVA